MQAEQTKIDPDEALWDRARDMLADELGMAACDVMNDGARMYVENHAPAYAAMLIAEDEDIEALYCEAADDAQAAISDMLPLSVSVVAPLHEIAARMAPVIVHSILRDRVAIGARQ